MVYLLLLILSLVVSGCASSSEPMLMPYLAAETLSENEVEGFEKILEATQQKGCLKTHGNLALYGQSGDWDYVGCYGMEKDEEEPYLQRLGNQPISP